MFIEKKLCLVISVLFILTLGEAAVLAQSAPFTYQGRLNDASAPANGQYDFTFRLFNVVSGGAPVGTDIVLDNVQVTNGMFTVYLDFTPFPFADNAGRFLEIAVRPGASSGAYSTLAPRQPINYAPYSSKSLYSLNAEYLGGLPANQYLTTAANANFIQNTTVQQATSNFNISGNGIIGGRLGIGTPSPLFKLQILDSSNTGMRVQTNTKGGLVASFGGFGDFSVDRVGIPGGRLWITEAGDLRVPSVAPAIDRFYVTSDGKVGINLGLNASPDKLAVNGSVSLILASGGSTAVCQNATNQLTTCSSSLRYKQNINSFSSGLDLIKRLRPVSFDWKADNKADLGLVAEEVAAIEPLLTTANEKGEVEGVKYDRVGVVLINAVSEQQTQIEGQQKQIETQAELIKSQQEKLTKQQSEIEALKRFVCSQNPSAVFCQP